MIRRSLFLVTVVLVGAAAALVVRSLSSNPSVLMPSLSRTAARTRAERGRGRAGAPAGATHESDPLTTPSARAYLRASPATISAAVEDLRTHQTWLYHPTVRTQTASIVKVDILQTLLRESQVSHTPLSAETSELAEQMIENSSDSAASALWQQVGGSAAVARYNAAAGLTETVPNDDGYWGETMTSALDQIRLLRQLLTTHGLLDRVSRDDELSLMSHVEADQTWGVSGGVPAGVSIALKNGWVPLTTVSNWEINSIGHIDGDGRDYLIAVLTAHDSGEGQGIATIQGLSRLVWKGLSAPAR